MPSTAGELLEDVSAESPRWMLRVREQLPHWLGSSPVQAGRDPRRTADMYTANMRPASAITKRSRWRRPRMCLEMPAGCLQLRRSSPERREGEAKDARAQLAEARLRKLMDESEGAVASGAGGLPGADLLRRSRKELFPSMRTVI